MSTTNIIDTLFAVIEGRKQGNPESSYVAKLFKKGRKKIAQKVAEEAAEVAIAAVSEGKKETVEESADLLFHLMVLWADQDISPEQITQELQKRMGTSGLEEKKSRKG